MNLNQETSVSVWKNYATQDRSSEMMDVQKQQAMSTGIVESRELAPQTNRSPLTPLSVVLCLFSKHTQLSKDALTHFTAMRAELEVLESEKNAAFSGPTEKLRREARECADTGSALGNSLFINRSAIKLAEMDVRFRLTESLSCFVDLCGGPGGFSQYLCWKNHLCSGVGITLNGENLESSTRWRYDRLPSGGRFQTLSGAPPLRNGCMLSSSVWVAAEIRNRWAQGVDLVVADGGFGNNTKELEQERSHRALLCSQLASALMCVKNGGHVVCKMFGGFEWETLLCVWSFSRHFRHFHLYKPDSSNPANSERYLIALDFVAEEGWPLPFSYGPKPTLDEPVSGERSFMDTLVGMEGESRDQSSTLRDANPVAESVKLLLSMVAEEGGVPHPALNSSEHYDPVTEAWDSPAWKQFREWLVNEVVSEEQLAQVTQAQLQMAAFGLRGFAEFMARENQTHIVRQRMAVSAAKSGRWAPLCEPLFFTQIGIPTSTKDERLKNRWHLDHVQRSVEKRSDPDNLRRPGGQCANGDKQTTTRSKSSAVDLTLPPPPPLRHLKGVILTTYTEAEQRLMSRVEVTTAEPGVPGSLWDPRMGAMIGTRCGTCHLTALAEPKCPGHHGAITLKRTMLNPLHIKRVIQVLQCICVYCGRLKVSEYELKKPGTSAQRFKLSRIAGILNERKCFASMMPGEAPCPGIHLDPRNYQTEASEAQACVLYTGGKGSQLIEMTLERPPNFNMVKADGQTVAWLFRKLKKEELDYLGFKFGMHPDNWLMRQVNVMPNVFRQRTLAKGAPVPSKLEGPYKAVIAANRSFGDKLDSCSPDAPLTMAARQARRKLATAIHSLLLGSLKDAMSKSSAIKKKLNSKEGLFRFCQGKRADHTARTVIGPEVEFENGVMGLAQAWQNVLHYPEYLTVYNYHELNRLALAGEVTRWKDRENRYIVISGKEEGASLSACKVPMGSVILRPLRAGDMAIENRNPTLTVRSMKAFLVDFVLDDRMTPRAENTGDFNADHDGDEMNVGICQTPEGVADARLRMDSRRRIVDELSGFPGTALCNDTTLIAHLATRVAGTIVPAAVLDWCLAKRPRSNFAESLMELDARLDRGGAGAFRRVARRSGGIGWIPASVYTATSRLRHRNRLFYPGRALMSACFPPDFFYQHAGVVIQAGVLSPGSVLTAVHVGSARGSVMQELLKQYSWRRASQFLTDAYLVLGKWREMQAFSIGLDDMAPPTPDQIAQMRAVTEPIRKEIMSLGPPPELQAPAVWDDRKLADSNKSTTLPSSWSSNRPFTSSPGQFNFMVPAKSDKGSSPNNGADDDETEARTAEDEEEMTRRAEKHEADTLTLIRSMSNAEAKLAESRFLTPTNRMAAMVTAGSKGSKFHIMQSFCALGQQFLLGARLRAQLTGGTRLLPSDAPGEYSLEARGFVSNSFSTGLTPSQLFNHQEATRESLVRVWQGTAECGDRSHRDMTSLENEKTARGGAGITDASNKIIQFVAGESGLRPGATTHVQTASGSLRPSFINLRNETNKLNAQYSAKI